MAARSREARYSESAPDLQVQRGRVAAFVALELFTDAPADWTVGRPKRAASLTGRKRLGALFRDRVQVGDAQSPRSSARPDSRGAAKSRNARTRGASRRALG